MSKQVNLYQAKTNLSRLVDEAARGEEIVIAKNGKAKARLVPMADAKPKTRAFGQWAHFLTPEEKKDWGWKRMFWLAGWLPSSERDPTMRRKERKIAH